MTTVVAYNTSPCPHCGCPDTKPRYDAATLRPAQDCPRCRETSKMNAYMAEIALAKERPVE